MTKKDQTRLAQVLKDSKPVEISKFFTADSPSVFFNTGEIKQWMETVESLAYMLQVDNPRFNKARFYNACGYSK